MKPSATSFGASGREFPPAPDTQAAPEGAPYVGHLGQQIHAMRQQQQADALDHYIAQAFPGAMPHERQWLRVNPQHLQNPMLVHTAAQIALQRGVPRESPEFLHFVGQLLDQHAAAAQSPAPPPPPAPAMPPPMPPPVAAPMAHVEIEQTESPDEESPMVAAHHVSAPVSRGEQYAMGEPPEPSASRITLSKAQREHAEAAGVSEIEYAKQLLKMGQMKKSGLLKD